MLLLNAMEITFSTDTDTSASLTASADQAVIALREAISLLAADGRNADFIMQAALQACIEQLPEFRQHLEQLEHSRMLARLDHLRKRGLLALA
ncbi:MAG: hypothetical protein KBG15_06540 [Kofleriaceae bacterium]|nr:hypothetical protein [Kofleriaceae bacterium]